MPKEYFTSENATALCEVPPGARVHVSGVCGVAMAQLALELSRRGYQVSGSDKEFYEPMGSLLRGSAIELHHGYDGLHIPSEAALVVIGNALSYQNAEVQEVERKGYAYSFFPKMLFDVAIQGRHSIVVSGTHGKSTTSALLAWLLCRLNLDPSFFVGAVIPDLPASFVVGSGRFCVTEGDEYDSAFFAKVPKFTFYKPDTLVVTAIEYDHADIYSSLAEIEHQFSNLVCGLPAGATAICCLDDANVARLLPEWRAKARCRILTYGTAEHADVRLVATVQQGRKQSVTLCLQDGTRRNFELAIPGKHNALNAISAIIACQINGLDLDAVGRVLPGFGGARRRQEVRYDAAVTLIDDFAHHPTAVRETLAAIQGAYAGRRLWAIFEPRSNSSRRKVFERDYTDAFGGASQVVLCDVAARGIDAGHDLIDVSDLAGAIAAKGTAALALPDAEAIEAYLLSQVKEGDVLLVMSNGGFGGLVAKLDAGLRQRFGS